MKSGILSTFFKIKRPQNPNIVNKKTKLIEIKRWDIYIVGFCFSSRNKKSPISRANISDFDTI